MSNDPVDFRRMRAAVRAGDHDAFTDLYRDTVGAVFRLGYRLTGSRALAEEVTAETFLAAWRTREGVRDEDGPLLPWLLGITARQSLNATRNVRRRLNFLARRAEAPLVDDVADEVAARLDGTRLLWRAQESLTSLSRAEAEVLALCVWSGLSYAEAAQALGIPIGTVRSRLARARARLRVLTNEGPTEPEPDPTHAQTLQGRR